MIKCYEFPKKPFVCRIYNICKNDHAPCSFIIYDLFFTILVLCFFYGFFCFCLMNISNANPIIADTQSIRLNIKYINNVVAGFFCAAIMISVHLICVFFRTGIEIKARWKKKLEMKLKLTNGHILDPGGLLSISATIHISTYLCRIRKHAFIKSRLCIIYNIIDKRQPQSAPLCDPMWFADLFLFHFFACVF